MSMKAVLVGVHLPEMEDATFEASMQELRRLVETLGFTVIGTLVQRRKNPSPAAVIGVGKLRELAAWTGGSGKIESFRKSKANEEEETEEALADFPAPTGRADKVIFDRELTPNQVLHLQQATGAEILDRTGVIVEIFHRHAKTQEARLQVEIARLKYLAPRFRAAGSGERQGGGVGAKGVGETAHELDRRRIRDRVAELQKELKIIHVGQGNRRQRRRDQCRVALVGYTNAGKSSLMRALTGDNVLVANKLFATLDTTVRAMEPDLFPRILVSDTVGFIKNLPHDLVASFRSTLDEAGEASYLLYVVDASDPTFREQLEVTRNVLSEIDAVDIPSKILLNKRDCLDQTQTRLLAREFPDALMISTKNPDDVQSVKNLLRDFVGKNMSEANLVIPYDDKSGLMGDLRKEAVVVREEHTPDGVHLTLRTFPETIEKFQKKLAKAIR